MLGKLFRKKAVELNDKVVAAEKSKQFVAGVLSRWN